jgi:hypothetical protein
VAAACVGLLGGVVSAETVTLNPLKDNTLYETPTGNLSNGQGDWIFAGRTLQGFARRAVLAFDLSSIPEGSEITAVSLTLTMDMTIAGDQTVTLHRLLADWGEGASNATGMEGAGGPSEAGDATWIHTFFNNQFWSTPGGDFDVVGQASAVVGMEDDYTWTSDAMRDQVQAWLDGTQANYGWLLFNEAAPAGLTAKRFVSSENADEAARPRLVVEFTPPGSACPGDLNGDNSVDSDDLSILLAAFGVGDAGDIDGDGDTDADDLGLLLSAFGSVC